MSTDSGGTPDATRGDAAQDDVFPPDVFPCLEQPIRVALHSRNGYYLWGLSNGRLVARSKRSEKDEFRLQSVLDASGNTGVVEIVNHKFGSFLQVVVEPEGGNGSAKVHLLCVKEEEEEGEHVQKEDRQWCFVREASGEGVLLKSLRTGDHLAVDDKGQVVLLSQEGPGTSMTWDVDCVTGELCFLSNANPAVDRRLRCDMAGLLTLTDAWKGWEVFRIMETGHHHYVKISSWMHSQWILCSTATGDVTCCTHAQSLLPETANQGRCSQWAIEKSAAGRGVILRSKTHGRLLGVQDGALKTVHPDHASDREWNTKDGSGDSGSWWSLHSFRGRSSVKDDNQQTTVPQWETLVWHLEAAHQQTYYFVNFENPKQPRSIGPFPYATSNLRQTDKIQLKRTPLHTKLFLTEKEQYISCSSQGEIALVYLYPDDDPNTEWVMEKPSYQHGGSVFRSKHHNFYLSYIRSDDGADTDAPEPSTARFPNPFAGPSEPVAQLVGTGTVGPREIWKLEPCMPRAVSSEKMKIFALGTGIAVGTTIALPFALAGASAVLGAVGAEAGVLFNAIAVTLTGAEALASVGAIGATAYIVFRPAENSLTDDLKKDDEEEGEGAWSKRPFSNWRNW